MIFQLFHQFGRTNPLIQKNKKSLFIISKYIFCIYILLLTSCNSNLKSRSFNFNYIVELEPSNGKKIELWLPVPQSNEVQKISNLSIDLQGLSYEIKDEKEHGNKYLYVFSNSGINISKTITMSFDVLRQEHGNVKYVNVNPEKYLSPTMVVPTGKIFDSIIENNKLNKNNMQSVYDFVLLGMHYGKPESINNQYYKEPWLSPKGQYGIKKVSRDEVVDLYKYAKSTNGNYTFGNGNSLYACDIGVGNCTDFHSYFMSLGRTMGIPIRFHMGFPIPDGKSGKVCGYHCWADFYVQGKGWYPVDISEADQAPKEKDYYFGTVCQNRLEMMIGRDIILKGYEPGIANLFIYPIMEVNDEKSLAFSKYFLYTDLSY